MIAILIELLRNLQLHLPPAYLTARLRVQPCTSSSPPIVIPDTSRTSNASPTTILSNQPSSTSSPISSREPTSVDEAPLVGRGFQDRRPPGYLSYYICHTACTVHPILASSTPLPSSGMQFLIAIFAMYDFFSDGHQLFLANVTTNLEPWTYKEAAQEQRWRVAMQAEIAALEKNKTWDLTFLPRGKRVIGCKWVYKTKYRSNASIERDKARLVVLGNHQTEGEDFTDTFAPVAKMVSVRTFLAVVVAKNLEVHQLDVNNTFSTW